MLEIWFMNTVCLINEYEEWWKFCTEGGFGRYRSLGASNLRRPQKMTIFVTPNLLSPSGKKKIRSIV